MILFLAFLSTNSLFCPFKYYIFYQLYFQLINYWKQYSSKSILLLGSARLQIFLLLFSILFLPIKSNRIEFLKKIHFENHLYILTSSLLSCDLNMVFQYVHHTFILLVESFIGENYILNEIQFSTFFFDCIFGYRLLWLRSFHLTLSLSLCSLFFITFLYI